MLATHDAFTDLSSELWTCFVHSIMLAVNSAPSLSQNATELWLAEPCQGKEERAEHSSPPTQGTGGDFKKW